MHMTFFFEVSKQSKTQTNNLLLYKSLHAEKGRCALPLKLSQRSLHKKKHCYAPYNNRVLSKAKTQAMPSSFYWLLAYRGFSFTSTTHCTDLMTQYGTKNLN